MASFTLAQLKLRARERGDMVNSRFISDSEITSYINASVSELYDLLIATRGENYYISEFPITTISGTKDYTLPAGFLKLMGVDWVISAGSTVNMQEFQWKERNLYTDPAWINGVFGNSRYQLRGGSITFSPTPTSSQAVNVWYIPKPTALAVDADTFDGINGWEEYVIIDVAIKMRVKEESPVQELLLAKKEMKERIAQASKGRDSSEPPRVQDTFR